MPVQGTLNTFRKNAKKLQWLVFGIPVIGSLIDRHASVYFPPLGDNVGSWRFFALLFAGASLALSYILPVPRSKALLPLTFFCCFVASAAAYLICSDREEVSITYATGDPDEPERVRTVIRGSERVLRIEPFASMSDEELIKRSGFSDERLKRIYTASSLRSNRIWIFTLYVLSLMLLELFLGSIAKGSSGGTQSGIRDDALV